MNDNAKPDRASDLDDEIPTYQAPSTSSQRETPSKTLQDPSKKPVDPAKSLYERAGGAAPQSIQPSERSNTAPVSASVQPSHVENPGEKQEHIDSSSHKESKPDSASASPRVDAPHAAEKAADDGSATVAQEPLTSEETTVADAKTVVAPEVISQAKVQHPPTDSFKTENEKEQPAPIEDKTTVFSAAPAASDSSAMGSSVSRTPGEEQTTTLDRDAQRHSQPLASDAPTSMYREPASSDRAAYRDEDFAPAGQPVASSTVVPPTPVAAPTTTAFAEPQLEQVPPVSPVAPQPDPASAHAVAAAAKRGTIDFGLFVLRIVFGAWLILDAVQVFFAMGNSGGINGLQDQFSSYAYASTLAVAVPAMELAAGVFLVFGLLTPVAAAVATVVTSFLTLHHIASADALNLTDLNDSIWFAFFLTTISLVLQFTGPGLISFDVSRSWAKRPLASSWVFVVLGIAGAVALWWFGAAVNPLV
ncbi:DoxX family protein [Corynebacterium pseudotuberculosis]|uniref:DoxX family protein n=1 Tax=Corynebacterium pseudotuberculosis TaxID=1719 RepID=UPI0002660699|nr:DoxX family protein [Corynebacterium pseudotuberculosis]AFM07238.1 DoxX family membrane protein [Corynebacterium pseudotuberculosis Cp162]